MFRAAWRNTGRDYDGQCAGAILEFLYRKLKSGYSGFSLSKRLTIVEQSAVAKYLHNQKAPVNILLLGEDTMIKLEREKLEALKNLHWLQLFDI